MSRIEWFVLFVVFVAYVLLGGLILHEIESRAENLRHEELLAERRQIQDLVRRELEDGSIRRTQVLEKLAEYCGKPVMFANSTENEEQPLKIWNFYNAFFVSITIVSSIGYGNMAPTTTATRMFCIVYALIGIPLNGILLAGMGEYFSRTFLRAHHRYKEAPEERSRMSLLLKVAQYLAAGICIFILLPAVVFVFAEDWYYDEAVYYAFVTLSTIGFGDYVAGYMTKYDAWSHSPSALVAYRTFIVLWILFGLGYLAMILSFITRALRSSRIRRLEHRMAKKLKNAKLWQGATKDMQYLRRVLNELYMLKFKVRLQNQSQARLHRLYRAANAAANAKTASSKAYYYREAVVDNMISESSLEHLATLHSLGLTGGRTYCDVLWPVQPVYRSTSLVPTFTRERSNSLPATLPSQLTQDYIQDWSRRRFDSEGPGMAGSTLALPRTASESCLDMIDRGATFAAAPRRVATSELLASVVDAFASAVTSEASDDEGAYHGLPDAEILASEGQPSLRSRASSLAHSLRSSLRSAARSRTVSLGPDSQDVEAPQPSITKNKGKESPVSLRKALVLRSAARELGDSPTSASPTPRRLRTQMDRRSSDGAVLVHSQRMRAASLAPNNPLQQLDDTSVADLLRALHSLHSRVEPWPETASPRSDSRRGSRERSAASNRLANQMLERLENGHVTSAPRDVITHAEPWAEGAAPSSDSRRGSRERSAASSRLANQLLERLENGHISSAPRDVMTRGEAGRRSRGRREQSTIAEETASHEKPGSDNESEKSLEISRL